MVSPLPETKDCDSCCDSASVLFSCETFEVNENNPRLIFGAFAGHSIEFNVSCFKLFLFLFFFLKNLRLCWQFWISTFDKKGRKNIFHILLPNKQKVLSPCSYEVSVLFMQHKQATCLKILYEKRLVFFNVFWLLLFNDWKIWRLIQKMVEFVLLLYTRISSIYYGSKKSTILSQTIPFFNLGTHFYWYCFSLSWLLALRCATLISIWSVDTKNIFGQWRSITFSSHNSLIQTYSHLLLILKWTT